MLGSSPLARGTYILNAALDLALRLIPTHAGNTLKSTLCMALTRAHPRSRGEHTPTKALRRRTWGSSPLTRGTSSVRYGRRETFRLISARAGNTVQAPEAPTGRTNHPRSHGEHLVPQSILKIWLGSSPLMRGTYQSDTAGPVVARLIPARAGNTCHVRAPRAHAWAHPRSRGEHSRSEISRSRVRGSSPLARGTSGVPYSPPGVCRLIPARAGNMPGQFFRVGRLAAHPRSRGDHVSMNSPCGVSVGSSPLARGPRGILRPLCALAGLIPARAGTTVVCGSVAGVPGAHPRSRGEHSVLVRARAWSLGSSPLARGTHTNRDSSLYRVGLIPARAGNTVHQLGR